MKRLVATSCVAFVLLAPVSADAALGPAEPLSGPDEYSANETQAAMTAFGQATVFWRGIAQNPPLTGVVARNRSNTGGWSAAEVVSDGMSVLQYSSDVAEHNGAAAVAWVGTDRDIWLAVRSSAGVWSAPEPVRAAPGTPGVTPIVRVAVNRFGQVVVAWRSEDTSPAGQSAFARYRSTAGVWEAAQNVSGTNDKGGDGLDLIADALGGFVAVWHRLDGDHRVGVATRDAGDAAVWSAPTDPAATETDTTGPPVAASDPSGGLLLAWSQRVAAPPLECPGCFYNQLWTVAKPAGGSWGAPQVASGGDVGVDGGEQPQIAFDSAGVATAAWIDNAVGSELVRSNDRSPAGEWSTPSTAHIATEDVTRVRLAVDAQAAATMLWRESAPISTTEIQLSTRALGGDWTTAESQAVTTSNLYASGFPAVAAAGNGGAVAAWNGQSILDTPPTGTFARFSSAQSSVAPPSPAIPTTPTIGNVRILPKKIYRKARVRGSKKRRKTSAQILVSLSEPADITLTLAFRIKGRVVGGRCVRASKRNMRRRACELEVPWGTPIAAGRHSGAAGIPFSSKGLRNGNYYLTVNAVSPSGRTAVPKRAKLTIG